MVSTCIDYEGEKGLVMFKPQESHVSRTERMMARVIEEFGEAEQRPSHMEPQSLGRVRIFSK